MAKVPTAGSLSTGMKVFTVGTGSSSIRLDRRGPCNLVVFRDTRVAVDLGAGALRGLLRAGVHPGAVDALLLTHLHPDHVADVVALLGAANFGEPPRTRPLFVAGGQGTAAYLRALRGAHGRWLDPRAYELEVRELSPGETIAVGDVSCEVGAVRHTASSVAYRFSLLGRSLVIAGDTGPSPELEAFSEGADVLILESTLAPDQALEGHLTPAQAGELARRSRVGKLVLNHLTPASDACSPSSLAAEAFGKRVVVARDGMRLRV